MLNRKFKKLLRDPKLFFSDMYRKRSGQIKKYLPLKHEGHNRFTVVSAVYNVEKYLDDYFASLTKQTLSFKKHIQIILVDDGSVDNSAQIIRKWQKKYPENIHYFYKENGGQASARNFGLEHVQTAWVTFIDPDDFVSPDYFFETDKILNKEKEIALVSVPIAVYKEDLGKYSYDTAPLTYCFKDKNKKVRISEMGNKIQLSVCTAFFQTKIIRQNNLYFNENIKPSFEDGKFVVDYFLSQEKEYIYFLDKVYYFYRTRADGSSTTNTQWLKKEKYLDVFKYGYIPMFENYIRKYKKVPLNIQFTFLYFAIQYIKMIVKNSGTVSFLSAKEKEEFLHFFQKCFEYIDKTTIMQFHLHGCSIFYKAGMINLFKNDEIGFMMVYVESIDTTNDLLELRFYEKSDVHIEYYIDGKYISPSFRKEKKYSFLENDFINEYHVWIDIAQAQELKITSNKLVKLIYKKQEFTGKILLNEINVDSYIPISGNPWIFIDKESKADDNAEHLYRYINKNHPEQPIYFVLSKKSPDWDRLKKENFNLLAFGSSAFKKTYKEASVIFSSHCDKYFTEYFGRNTLKRKRFVFLQHGVIMHDLSEWLNNVPKIDIFCTSTVLEQNYIGGENSPYKYSKEVRLTGLTRHDALLHKSEEYRHSKNIMIMPTWRNHIVGALIPGKVSRKLNPNFKNTDYFKYWYEFLHSQEVKNLVTEAGYTLTFIPHPNIADYLDLFELPDYIENPAAGEDFSIQDGLAKSCLLITDYSSVTFDMAFLNRPTLYYQFDAETFFSGSHTSSQGYFDYVRDGFGKVSHNLQELLEDLRQFITNQGKVSETYIKRITNLYLNRDGNNCERVYHEVMSLQHIHKDINKNRISILKNMITQAENFRAWKIAASRIDMMLEQHPELTEDAQTQYRHRYLNALYQDNKFVALNAWLDEHQFEESDYWHAKINLQIGNAKQAVGFFAQYARAETEELFTALLAAAYIRHKTYYEQLSGRLKEAKLSSFQPLMLKLAEAIYQKKYFSALALIEVLLDKMDNPNKKIFKLELLAAYLNMALGNLSGAHQCLVRYERHTRNDPACRIAIARLAKFSNSSDKLFDQLNKAFGDTPLLIPEDLVPDYLKKLHALDNIHAEEYLLDQFKQKYPYNKRITAYRH